MTSPPRLFPHLPERLAGLEDLAENLWWSWHPRARMLFKLLDRQAWKQSVHNPDLMLRNLPADLLATAAADPERIGHNSGSAGVQVVRTALVTAK